MKKITLSCLALLFTSAFFAQTYSTGTLNLLSNGGTGLSFSTKIDVTASTVTLTLMGPSTGWLSIGFNNTTMADSGDVVIFDGSNLTDRHFAGFAVLPELDAQQDWTITSNTVTNSIRTVVGTRARTTGDANDYIFSASAQSLNLVYARKFTDFSLTYHGGDSCGTRMASFTLGNEDYKIDDFKLSPNPAKGLVSIELPANVDSGILKIYDALGRLVKTQTISTTENTINASGLSTGSYMVVLRTDYGNATKTLIIE